MFELRRSDDGLVSISDSFTNFSVVSYVDLLFNYPTTAHYPFTDETLVFRRVLRYELGLPVRRFIFCERKTTPLLPSTGEPGLVLYNASGNPVFSSAEEYVKFVGTKAHSLSGVDPYGDAAVISSGNDIPAPKYGGYVYVLHNTASVIWTFSGEFFSGDITYTAINYDESTPSKYRIYTTKTVNFFQNHICGIRYATSSGHVVSFAEFSF